MSEDEYTAAELADQAASAAMTAKFARDGIPGAAGHFTAEEQAAILADLDESAKSEFLVSRSLRMPYWLHVQVSELARSRGVSFSALLRDLMVAGLEQAAAGAEPDPVGELHRIQSAATRALNALGHSKAA